MCHIEDKKNDNHSVFNNSRLSIKSKKFWMIIFIPPIIPTLIALIIFLIGKEYNLIFKDKTIVIMYFSLCFLIFILMVLIDFTQAIYKNFIKENAKGKIISLIILGLLIIKAIYEILRLKR